MDEQKLFKKIYDNYVETGFLNILLLVKNKNVAIEIIKSSLDRIFLFDYRYFDLLDFSVRLKKYLAQGIKEYISQNSNNDVLEVNVEIDIPKVIYQMISNIDRILNETDNILVINYSIYNKDIKDLSILFNIEEEYIKNKFLFVIRIIRENYLNTIKNELEKTIRS